MSVLTPYGNRDSEVSCAENTNDGEDIAERPANPHKPDPTWTLTSALKWYCAPFEAIMRLLESRPLIDGFRDVENRLAEYDALWDDIYSRAMVLNVWMHESLGKLSRSRKGIRTWMLSGREYDLNCTMMKVHPYLRRGAPLNSTRGVAEKSMAVLRVCLLDLVS